MADVADTRISTLFDLARALRESDVAVRAVQDQATKALSRVSREVATAVSDARSQLAQAEARLRECQARREEDCSGPRRAVEQARERLQCCQQAMQLVEQANARLVSSQARYSREMLAASREGQALLAAAASDLGVYLGMSFGDTGGSAALSAPSSAPSIAPVPGAPAGYASVPLALIDASTNSTVTGRGSFGKGYSPEDLSWAYTTLREQVLPAMSAGHGLDYFQARDQAEGRMGARSYTDTFLGFFGDNNAIRLERQADGTFRVGNGFHRIWVAQQLGLDTIPAKIR